MKKYAGSLNRTWLALIGFVLIVAGALWVLVATGLAQNLGLAWSPEDQPLTGAEALLEQSWLPAALIALGALLVILALLWIIRQIPRTERADTLQFQQDARRGVTTVDAKVITDAVATQVEDLTDVVSAKAVLRGHRSEAQLVLDVVVNERGDIQAVGQQISEEVLPAVARAVGRPLQEVGMIFEVTRQTRSKRQIQVQ